MSYPNQYLVTIQKVPRDNGETFAYMSTDALQNAMNNLKECSLRLWLYLAKNQTHHKFWLSPKECEKWGITESSYKRAKKDLEEKGYLRLDHGNKYIFIESPQLEINSAQIEIEELPSRKQQTPQKNDNVLSEADFLNLPGLQTGVSFHMNSA